MRTALENPCRLLVKRAGRHVWLAFSCAAVRVGLDRSSCGEDFRLAHSPKGNGEFLPCRRIRLQICFLLISIPVTSFATCFSFRARVLRGACFFKYHSAPHALYFFSPFLSLYSSFFFVRLYRLDKRGNRKACLAYNTTPSSYGD